LTTCGFGAGGGGGGGVGSGGLGGSMNWLRISTGITTSAARRNKPLCSAQSTATWTSTTLPAMTTLRERPAVGAEKRSDTVNHFYSARSAARANAANRYDSIYFLRIHQTEPATKIRLPPSAKTSSMRCFPRWNWQAGSFAHRRRGAWPRPDARRCTGRPRRARILRTGHTGWPRRVRTALRRTSCPHAHDARYRDQTHGDIRRRSWQGKRLLAGWLKLVRL